MRNGGREEEGWQGRGDGKGREDVGEGRGEGGRGSRGGSSAER